jgi:hypothetical protein
MAFTGDNNRMRQGVLLALAGTGVLSLVYLLNVSVLQPLTGGGVPFLWLLSYAGRILLVAGCGLCWTATQERWPWFLLAAAAGCAGLALLLSLATLGMGLVSAPAGAYNPLAVRSIMAGPALVVTAASLFLCALMLWRGEEGYYGVTRLGTRRWVSPYTLPGLSAVVFAFLAIAGLVRGNFVAIASWVFLVPLALLTIAVLVRVPRAEPAPAEKRMGAH